ncbi:Tafazzin [Heracleum sosnowskyi]|uniref:Tafazzin family protein n=1 Tax=Heracleum sosnowskyi TaxID=360622 RepID=A0AAD8IQ66_9APIA|nr:Tafazzin [Heracleum sosnowskyi]
MVMEIEGEEWKDKARSLQLLLRHRFRVAVDRHRPCPPDGYLSTRIQLWIDRFRNFRQDSLPSSTKFYLKRVSQDIDMEGDSVLTRMLQAVAVPVFGNVCYVFMHGLNRVQIYGAEKLHQALQHRPSNKPLITVSNHVASLDDPLVISALIPPSVLLDAHNLRWTLCASDRCFKNPVTSAFFKHVKVLPLTRGEGVYQKGMDIAIAKLNRGGWVHIFPEGSRSRDGGKTIGLAKRGIGRLVLDADIVPMVVPFVHTGMQDIMPIGAKFPRIGKTVTVLVGDPVEFDDLLGMEGNPGMSRGKLYDAVSARVDWESLGMEDYIGLDEQEPPKQNFVTERKAEHVNGKENTSQNRYFRMGLSYEGGIVSRIRGYMDPTELMGFAARGIFTSSRVNENFVNLQRNNPLKAWKNFMEAHLV